MEFFTLMGMWLFGCLCGFAVMAVMAAGAYNRGYKDCKNELPTDISNYLDDQL